MNHAEQQQLEELNVFQEFAKVCPLSLVASSAQNRDTPEPDILCNLITGQQVAFELGQAEDVTTYDNGKGETYVASVQKKEQDDGSSYCIASPAIVQRVEDKLKKRYETDHPIHLVVWSLTACVPEVGFWREELESLLRSNGLASFQRIWVFGYGESSIVFDFDIAELRDLVAETNELAEMLRDDYESISQASEVAVVEDVIEYASGGGQNDTGIAGRVLESLFHLHQDPENDSRRDLEQSKQLLIASWNLVHCAETARQKQAYARCVQNGSDKRQLLSIDHRFDQTARVVKETLDEYRDWYSR